MSKVLVTLDYEELEYCAISGARRNIRAMQKDRKPRDKTSYSKQNWWQSNITGVIGEYAVAKSLGEHCWRESYSMLEYAHKACSAGIWSTLLIVLLLPLLVCLLFLLLVAPLRCLIL